MKTILVDAVNCLISESGEIFKEMYSLLENFPNKKIILTGANDEQAKRFKLDRWPYPVFTLKHNPEKTDPEYYKQLLKHFNIDKKDVVYFEHSPEAVKSAESVGIITYYYDNEKKDLVALRKFLIKNAQNNNKMSQVKVLIQGYAREENGIELASSTTVLIKEGKINIIVDPGMDKKMLMDALKKEKLAPKDFQYVILTHNHPDHFILCGIFENALFLDDTSSYSLSGEIKSHDGKVPGTDIEIIKTPGHDMFHCSIIVNDEKLGKVAIVGDVIFWYDHVEPETDTKTLLECKSKFIKDKKALYESRKKVLSIADYIIPGHGKMFKVEK